MKIALAQISTVVADFQGNGRKILEGVERARREGAEVVLFPELAVTSYPPRDLLDRPDFAREAARTIAEIAPRITGITAVVGNVVENPAAAGKPLYNGAQVIENGRVTATYRKCLLPTYDVFDEARYFEPNADPKPWILAGRPAALSVCEDIWDDPDHSPMRRYGLDPVGSMVEAGGRMILNISASPFHMGKPKQRHDMLARIAAKHGVPLAYVNMVGGNDELVFDGRSVVLDAEGRLIAEGRAFAEDFLVVDVEAGGRGTWTPREPLADAHDALVLGLRDYARKCGFKTATLGLSGGVDSALTAVLAAEALGPENVLGVSMPSRFTASMSREDAGALARNLGITFEEIAIESIHGSLLDGLAPSFHGKSPDITEENLQARIRGTLLMALSNKHGHLLLSTGNKSELAVGYCTLYGDMCGGLAPISDVPKTMVYALCARINATREVIPNRILTRPPSAELRADQTDQDSLPPYEVLDRVLDLYVVGHRSIGEIVEATGFDEATVRNIAYMIERSEYKRRQAAPGIKISEKAFGLGRRVPLARAF